MKRLIRFMVFLSEATCFTAIAYFLKLAVISTLSRIGVLVPDLTLPHLVIVAIIAFLLLWPMLIVDRAIWRWLVKKGVAEPQNIDGDWW